MFKLYDILPIGESEVYNDTLNIKLDTEKLKRELFKICLLSLRWIKRICKNFPHIFYWKTRKMYSFYNSLSICTAIGLKLRMHSGNRPAAGLDIVVHR